jgi:hypothetical protein
VEWEDKYPQVLVRALSRGISYHAPLILDTESLSQPKASGFRFELVWMFKDGFHEKVREVWRRESKGSTSMEIWQNKIRALRRYLRGWEKIQMGNTRRKRKRS